MIKVNNLKSTENKSSEIGSDEFRVFITFVLIELNCKFI